MTFDTGKIPLYKRLLSYFHPVWLRQYKSEANPYLELLIYRGRIQLGTQDALYSDGDAYTPAQAIIDHLKTDLPGIKKVLLLGVGLGSTVSMLHKAAGTTQFTLVELDEVILRLALERLNAWPDLKLAPHCVDAAAFVATNTEQFDLVFIDIFNSRTVPPFVSSLSFLSNCRKSLAPGGIIAFNYIINDMSDWQRTLSSFNGVFPTNHIVKNDINRIFIGRTPANKNAETL